MKSDEEFLDGIYQKAEQRKKEEIENRMARPKWKAAIGMMAACFCFLLAFSVFGRKAGGDAGPGGQEGHNTVPEDPNAGIQMLNLEGADDPSDAGDVPAARYGARAVGMEATLFGTVQKYTEGTGNAAAVLCLEEEGLGAIEIYVTCEEAFAEGEEVALLLTAAEDMYYLTALGQKYKKGKDGLYYNTFGEVLPEGMGGQ